MSEPSGNPWAAPDRPEPTVGDTPAGSTPAGSTPPSSGPPSNIPPGSGAPAVPARGGVPAAPAHRGASGRAVGDAALGPLRSGPSAGAVLGRPGFFPGTPVPAAPPHGAPPGSHPTAVGTVPTRAPGQGGPAGWPAQPGEFPGRRPSGLFPAPARPTYREPHQAGGAQIAIGVLAGTVWMALLGVLGTSARSYVWWTIAAGVLGWGAALLLARFGDRGVAVGVALACAIGVAIGFVVVTLHWAVDGYWLLW